MGLLKNKKGVESLPLRYIIIALVAALVIGIALQFVGILRGGTISSANKINETLAEKTTCELDEEAPVITFINGNCSGNKATITIKATDDCGIDLERIGFYANSEGGNGTWADLTLINGTINNGYWNGTTGENSTLYGTGKNVTGVIVAFDKTPVANEKIEPFVINETCS